MASKKEELAELLEKYLPKLEGENIEVQREALRRILQKLDLKKFELAIETAREPFSFGYNLLLWAYGLNKEVRGAGTLKPGLTEKERMEKENLTPEEIETRLRKLARDKYKNNCFGRLSEVGKGEHVSLSKTKEVEDEEKEFRAKRSFKNEAEAWAKKSDLRTGRAYTTRFDND